MVEFYISTVQMEISVDAIHRSYQIVKHLNTFGMSRFFPYIKKKMDERWTELLKAMEGNTRFEILSLTGSFYVWVHCKDNQNCVQEFADIGIAVLTGVYYGRDESYV